MILSHTSRHFKVRQGLLGAAKTGVLVVMLLTSDLNAADVTKQQDSIRAVRAAGQDLWIGGDGGLQHFDGKSWRQWTRGKELPDYAVSAIDVDEETGAVWIGLWGGGLARLTADRVDRFTQFSSGLAGDIVFAVALAHGRIWVATNGGVSALEPWRETWSLYGARHAGAVPDFIASLAVESSALYSKSHQGVVRRFDPQRDEWLSFEGRFPESPTSHPDKARPHLRPNVPARAPEPVIAVYGPRNLVISLPPGPGVNAADPPIPDMPSVGRVTEIRHRKRDSGEKAIGVVTVLPGYSRYGWGLPEDDIVTYAANPAVVAVLGNAHYTDVLTAAVVEGTRIPWVNVDLLEPHVFAPNQAPSRFDDDGWTFACFGDLARQHRVLLDHVIDRLGATRITILRERAGDEELPFAWWQRYIKRRGGAVAETMIWEQEESRRSAMLSRLRAARPEAILTWSSGTVTEAMIIVLRKASVDGWIVTGPSMVNTDITAASGVDPGRLITLIPTDADRPARQEAEPASGAGKASPSPRLSDPIHAARTEMATQHLLAAIERAGASRPQIRRTLHDIRLDPFGETHAEQDAASSSVTIAHFDKGTWRTDRHPTQ